MNAREAALYVGVSARFLWNETHRPGSSLRVSRLGSRLVYRKAELDRWLDLKAIPA
jgi:hypothetical protein